MECDVVCDMECEYCPYNNAKERYEKSQIEYLCCAKVGGKHLYYGYCFDENNNKPISSKNKNKKSIKLNKARTRNFRRYYKYIKTKRLKNIIENVSGGVNCFMGYIPIIDYDPETDTFIKGKYIKYPKNSNLKKLLKKTTSRKVRHLNKIKCEDIPQYNGYRKYYNKWHILD